MAGKQQRRREAEGLHDQALAAISRGDFATAAQHWRAALTLEPAMTTAWHNLGLALARLGDVNGSVTALAQALTRTQPSERASTLGVLAGQLRRVPNIAPDPAALPGLEIALRAENRTPQPFASAVLAVLVGVPPLGPLMVRGAAQGWDAAVDALLARSGDAVLSHDLLRLALTRGVNTRHDVELLLTALRRRLLLAPPPDLVRRRPLYEFVAAMAQQALNNEHVWGMADDERAALDDLLARWNMGAAAMLGDGTLLRLLLYRSPAELFGTASPAASIRPRELADLVGRELAERAEERAFAANLPTLGAIVDSGSQAVAAQYEANPYPRWLAFDRPDTGSARAELAPRFAPPELAFMGSPYRVLVAGCGTGREAITLAIQHGPNGRVLGIDLSSASLAWAARMAQRYGVANLDLARADLLDLGDTGEPFAVIAASGVLHHMDEPMAGWRSLAARLAPGGLMAIGLYSAHARAAIARERDAAMAAGVDFTDMDAIRAWRMRMLTRPDRAENPLWGAYDFYTLSAMRDAFFHVREKRFTIPEIATALEALGLEFRGFRFGAAMRDALARANAPTPESRDLLAWDGFERHNPHCFIEMYQFWCRKPA
ncbi:MAG: methyltransferase domain-containing protein [Alphaproteobacteria bacterium]